jgi:imidazolonepropionase-like amidohydrolase
MLVVDGSRVAFAGPALDLGVVVSSEGAVESLSGGPIPPEADEELWVDGFVMPGVVDRHVHIALSEPRSVLEGGVTAVRDLGWPPDVIFSMADASESPGFAGPLIRAAGPIITCPGGYPTRSGWAPPGTGLEVRGPEEAHAVAHDVATKSNGLIKVALNSDAGPTLSDQDLVAICEAAAEEDALVTCHAQGRGQVERALGAGIHELAHCPWSERLDDRVIEAMAGHMRIVSTLDIKSYGMETPELGVALDNLRRFIEVGGRVAYGTDLGNGPIPAGIHPGEARHLSTAGLSMERILQAMTFLPLAPGEPADLVALDGNPLENIDALGRVTFVMRGGRRIR